MSSKAEVSRWPIFGWLAKLQRTIFVERADRAGAARQRDEIRRRLDAGDNLILFPEGTSGDGIHLLPFKSTLFAAAEDERVMVQPVSVVYRLLDGIPLGRFYRPFFAWYGDMTMAPHLWKMLGLGQLTVVMTFHEPVRLKDFGSRKLLSEHCATNHRRRHGRGCLPDAKRRPSTPPPRTGFGGAVRRSTWQRSENSIIRTYGCQMNVYDSARMADVLAPLGYARTDAADDADMILLNTCHIREKAAEKLFSDLGRLRAAEERQGERRRPACHRRLRAASRKPKAKRFSRARRLSISCSDRRPITACRK